MRTYGYPPVPLTPQLIYILRHDVDWHLADEEINFRRKNETLTAEHLRNLVLRHTDDQDLADSAAAKFLLNATRKSHA